LHLGLLLERLLLLLLEVQWHGSVLLNGLLMMLVGLIAELNRSLLLKGLLVLKAYLCRSHSPVAAVGSFPN
jgi:hypothetical protein